MSDSLRFILSLSIIPAVIIGILRFRKIDRSWYPFIYNVTIVLLVEIVLRILMKQGLHHSFNVVQNVFSFIDFLMFAWLFHNWHLFNNNKSFFVSFITLFFLTWIFTAFFATGITRPNFYFLAIYSSTLVFLGITTFGKVIIQEQKYIFTNAKFWTCLGIIIFYTFFIIICATQMTIFKINVSRDFQDYLQRIVVYSNLFANILYAVAVIWIPKKKNFISLSS